MSERALFPGIPLRLARDKAQAPAGLLLPLLPLRTARLEFAAGGKRILDGVDLELGGDVATVIMGPNGAGKSVLLRLIHGLLEPTGGSVLWNGQPPHAAVRRRQAMVFQRPVLLRRSVMANLRFALGLRALPDTGPRTRDILALAGLEHLTAQPARVLSGGEQQRLAMVRALLLEPEVLLLDEPTASLDPASVLAVEQLIGAARMRGAKVILVTHDRGQARRIGDEIVFLHRGRVTEVTPAARFFDKPASEEAGAYLDGRILL